MVCVLRVASSVKVAVCRAAGSVDWAERVWNTPSEERTRRAAHQQHVVARVEARSPLAAQDVAGQHVFPRELLNPQSLRLAVAPCTCVGGDVILWRDGQCEQAPTCGRSKTSTPLLHSFATFTERGTQAQRSSLRQLTR